MEYKEKNLHSLNCCYRGKGVGSNRECVKFS